MKLFTRRSLLRLSVLFLLLAGALVACYFYMLDMPGRSHAGLLPPITQAQLELADELERYVTHLAGAPIGDRNLDRPDNLDAAIIWLTDELTLMGYDVRRQEFSVNGQPCVNLDIENPGSTRPGEIIVIGAHYDSVTNCPGANDNGSGCAAVLAMARHFAHADTQRTLRFALFTNEEPPYFHTETMGSLVYARGCEARGESIVAMFSMETIGYYSDAPGSQKYPPVFNWLYPDTGNFIAFVGNLGSRALVRESISIFRNEAKFPSEGAAVPGWMTGIGWSDHWSFWQAGFPAVMITDTAPFRYPHYHKTSDTPDKIDYERTARVVEGVIAVVDRMSNPDR